MSLDDFGDNPRFQVPGSSRKTENNVNLATSTLWHGYDHAKSDNII